MNILYAILISLGIGVFFASLHSIFYFVFRPSKKSEKLEEITKKLPGLNCGNCGYVNCENFAKNILNGVIKNKNACPIMNDHEQENFKDFLKTITDDNNNQINLL